MEKPKTFEEMMANIQSGNSEFEYDKHLADAKRIHFQECKRFVRVMVIKKIERSIDRQKKTMATRTKKEQDLLGAYLTVLEQEFKDEVKSLL